MGLSATYVLDASALLAAIRAEPGGLEVRERAAGCAISAVNLSEAIQVAQRDGRAATAATDVLSALGISIVPLGIADAIRAAELWPVTRAAGLSLADRCCLALAERLGATALTADRAWVDAGHGVPVALIR